MSSLLAGDLKQCDVNTSHIDVARRRTLLFDVLFLPKIYVSKLGPERTKIIPYRGRVVFLIFIYFSISQIDVKRLFLLIDYFCVI